EEVMRTVFWLFVALMLIAMILLVACGGGGGGTGTGRGAGQGTVNLTISDPATCGPPQGPYSHIYLTVTDVQVNQSATASPTDGGWIDLTPGLKPMQIDFLATPNGQCILATLVSNATINAGTYQQMRIILLDNTKASQLTTNNCTATSANCVVL